MEAKLKTILLAITALVLSVVVVIAAVWCTHHTGGGTCTGLDIRLVDSAKRQWVTVAQLDTWVHRHGLNPIGKELSTIDCDAIEHCLTGHNMVRTAECYITTRGTVRVRVTQRIPVMKVLSADDGYYVDSDRKRMPLNSRIQLAIPTFTGHISERAATHEYFDFALWITQHNYWNTRIASVEVINPRHLILHQHQTSTVILLGSVDGYERKLNKLQKLYTKGFDQIGYTEYRELDLRFAGQVVGR